MNTDLKFIILEVFVDIFIFHNEGILSMKITEKHFPQQPKKNSDDSELNVDCILQNHFPHSLLWNSYCSCANLMTA